MSYHVFGCYRRHKQRRTEKRKGRFICTCGYPIGSWKGFVVPIFTKIKESTLLAESKAASVGSITS